MLQTRVIPVLLIKERGLYKGVKFKKHKYVGDPINTVKIFNEKEVDELVIIDISVTIENKEIDYELIKEIASEAFMPLAYGGGIKTVDDARKIFSLGIEKVILNSEALNNPNLIDELSAEFGAQSIVFSLDVKKDFFGKQRVYSNCGTIKVKGTPSEIALKMEENGVGEIIAPHYEIKVGKETIAFIYEPLACHSYNEIKFGSKTVRIATIDTMLSFYLAFAYVKRPYYNEGNEQAY